MHPGALHRNRGDGDKTSTSLYLWQRTPFNDDDDDLETISRPARNLENRHQLQRHAPVSRNMESMATRLLCTVLGARPLSSSQ